MRTVPIDLAIEEENHQRILDLTKETHNGLAILYQGLGDSSWRVRKAAQAAVSMYQANPQLLPALIGGLASQDNAGLRNACAEVLVALGEYAVAALGSTLGTHDADQRKFIVEILGSIGSAAALQCLLGALSQTDSNVRAAVVDALGHIGGPQVVALLVERLTADNQDLQLCVYLMDALYRCGACLSAEFLLPFLEKRSLARFVYPLLGLSRDVRAMQPLADAVLKGNRTSRRAALPSMAMLCRSVSDHEALRRLAAIADGRRQLLEALADEDVGVAGAAMTLLGAAGDAAAMAEVLEVGATRNLSQIALDATLMVGPPVVPFLLEAIPNTTIQASLLALDAVESVGGGDCVPALLELVHTSNTQLTGAAVRVLGKLGGPGQIEPLVVLARQRDDVEITRHVVLALSSMGARFPKEVAAAMHRAIAAGDVLPAWLHVLGSLRRLEDLTVLAAACRHRNGDVRRAALEAAYSLGSAMPQALVLNGLRDEAPEVRAAAAKLAGACQDDVLKESLIDLLLDADPWVVAEAARALRPANEPAAVLALEQATRHGAAPVAIAALQALSHRSQDYLEPLVRRALHHNDSEVVREALQLAAIFTRPLAYDLLIAALQHRAWDVRWKAAEYLTRLKLSVDAALLQRCIDHEVEPLVRDKLAQLELGRGGQR